MTTVDYKQLCNELEQKDSYMKLFNAKRDLFEIQRKLKVLRFMYGSTTDTEEKTEHLQCMTDLQDQYDMLSFTVANEIGLDELKQIRTEIGKLMHCYSLMQKEAYKLQKQRYQSCRADGVFTEKDRSYIKKYQQIHSECCRKIGELCDQRDEASEMIDHLDPDDPDYGIDEYL
jgi:hypothetical protein